jgi:hypothetical protein
MIALYAIGLLFFWIIVINIILDIFDEALRPYREAKIKLRKVWLRYRYGTDNLYEVAKIRNNLVEGSDGQYRDSNGEIVTIDLYPNSWIYAVRWDKAPFLREYR